MRDLRVPLYTYFTQDLKKAVTKDNCVDLCVIAAQSPLIFWPEVKNKFLDNLMGMEFSHMYRIVHEIPPFSAYTRLIREVLRPYNASTFQEKANLVAIFETLTVAISEFEAVRIRHGLPELP